MNGFSFTYVVSHYLISHDNYTLFINISLIYIKVFYAKFYLDTTLFLSFKTFSNVGIIWKLYFVDLYAASKACGIVCGYLYVKKINKQYIVIARVCRRMGLSKKSEKNLTDFIRLCVLHTGTYISYGWTNR